MVFISHAFGGVARLLDHARAGRPLGDRLGQHSEMKAPPKPIRAAKPSSAEVQAVRGQVAVDAEQAGRQASTSMMATLVRGKG
jgi:hypothetical protein